ncbi:hypothetical protein [Streptacidiphilus sp. MAP5-3]|uniref:hypothetical protein n=1 Tax=unclassified Streptacidiphilus TaxID=2643834 RepID=UPI003519B3E4
MLQRNATDHPLDVPAIPATVQPGETVDWKDPIVGFEPVEAAPVPEPSPPKTARKQAAVAAGEEPTP